MRSINYHSATFLRWSEDDDALARDTFEAKVSTASEAAAISSSNPIDEAKDLDARQRDDPEKNEELRVDTIAPI